MKKFTGLMTVVAAGLMLTGCSFGAPKTQMVSVVAKPQDAEILINGSAVTSGSQVELSRGGDFNIHVSKDGYYSVNKDIKKSLSKIGMADVVGGCFFLVPLAGLFDDGAWEFTKDNVVIELYPED